MNFALMSGLKIQRLFGCNIKPILMSQGDDLGLAFSREESRTHSALFMADFFHLVTVEHPRQLWAERHAKRPCLHACSLVCQWPPPPVDTLAKCIVREREEKEQVPEEAPQMSAPVIPVFAVPRPDIARAPENDVQRTAPEVAHLPQAVHANPELRGNEKAKTRSNFSPQQRQLLERFVFEHLDHPYAEQRDLDILQMQTNLSKKQIRVFLTNARMRKVPKYGARARGRRPQGMISIPNNFAF